MNRPVPTRTVVMVDVYATMMRLAQAYADAGCAVVRLRDTPELPDVYRAHDGDGALFADTIVHDGDHDLTIEAVAEHTPIAVVTGGELSVEPADQLSEALRLTSNGTALSAARRDKDVQVETVRAAGLRTARQHRVTDAAELTAGTRQWPAGSSSSRCAERARATLPHGRRGWVLARRSIRRAAFPTH